MILNVSGRGVLVEYTGEAIQIICGLVHDVRRRLEADSGPDYSSLLEKKDVSRITYHLTKKSFKVTTKLISGRKENKYFPIKAGVDAKVCLDLARMDWNQFDTSGSEPYVSHVK